MSPDEIQRGIDETRSQVDHTIDALQRKLSPGKLMDDAMEYLRNGPGDIAGNVGRAVRDNPVPAALIGLGVGWMILSGMTGNRSGERRLRDDGHEEGRRASRRGAQAASRASSAAYRWTGGESYGASRPGQSGDGGSYAERGEELASRARHTAEETTDRARRTAEDLSHRVKERAQEAGGAVRHAASQVGETARRQGERLGEGYRYMLHEHPLVLAGLALSAGALLAVCLPSTRRENELIGEASDRVKGAARDMGEQTVDAAKRAAESAKDAAAKTFEEEMPSTSDVRRREDATIHQAQAATSEGKPREQPQATEQGKTSGVPG